jgi:hypothetical protein
MSLAQQLDLREQYTTAPPLPAGRGLLPVLAPHLALPAPPAPKADTSTVTVEGQPVKRLTQAEQEERRRLGLCYNCDEKFGRGITASVSGCSSSTAPWKRTSTKRRQGRNWPR